MDINLRRISMPISSIVKDYLVSGSDLLTIYRQWKGERENGISISGRL